MSIRVRKVVYTVHMDQLDDDGHVVNELSMQEPLTLWEHEFEQLREQVARILERVEAQLGAQPC